MPKRRSKRQNVSDHVVSLFPLPLRYYFQRGTGTDIAIIMVDEFLFTDVELLLKIIIPLSLKGHTILIFSSSMPSADNSALPMLSATNEQTGENTFLNIVVHSACAACIANKTIEFCQHNEGNIPEWQSDATRQRAASIYRASGGENAWKTEVMNSVEGRESGEKKAFQIYHIAELGRPERILEDSIISTGRYIITTIDPAEAGEGSDWVIQSSVLVENKLVVRSSGLLH